MTTTDPIADYLARLHNAIRAHHKKLDVPASAMKREISKILVEYKYINSFSETPDNRQGMLRINLKYTDGNNAIAGLKRISKPGRRVYVSADKLPRVLNSLGIAVLSTSNGLMTDRKARERHVGGEVLCYIW